MSSAGSRIAIVHCSGRMKWSLEEQTDWLDTLRAQGISCEDLRAESLSTNGFTAGACVERAILLSRALTFRKFPILWAARGGTGVTALIPLLERMLPPHLPTQTLIGFSDVSYLGVWLSLRYPNLTYVHGPHAFDTLLRDGKLGGATESRLRTFLQEAVPAELEVSVSGIYGGESLPKSWSGIVVPLNLSLAESLAATSGVNLPENSVLFLEDVNEHVYALLRKLDSLRNAGWFKNMRALVLGDFAGCTDAAEKPISNADLTEIVAKHLGFPVFSLPVFGHGNFRMPLVAFSACSFQQGDSGTTITLGSKRVWRECVQETPRISPAEQPDGSKGRVHFTGIGGTGMCALAGLVQEAGFTISGSDLPIYPPMDAALKAMGLKPVVGYHGDTLAQVHPDAVVLANVVSPRNAKLEPNLEFQALLSQETTAVFSFPSALRHFFLRDAQNLVVAGTHGKTTSVSLIAHVLDSTGHAPSFLVGGTPKNFGAGFRLANRELFVLEGDEYDSAYFDKGAKFHHYEPGVALINNMEFDHADIFSSIEEIKEEFSGLLANVKRKNGIAVVNLGCAHTMEVAGAHPHMHLLGFNGTPQNLTATLAKAHDAMEREAKAHGTKRSSTSASVTLTTASGIPFWTLNSATPHAKGQFLVCTDPAGTQHRIDVQMFGPHSASNVVACLAVLHAQLVLSKTLPSFTSPIPPATATAWARGFASFEGVKRRFELLVLHRDIAVFDDFAHHPTAIGLTLGGFRDYIESARSGGRLIACFDPRNATMRRSVLQGPLALSLRAADAVFIGPVLQDLRLQPGEAMDGEKVARECGSQARYFHDDASLLLALTETTQPGDTVVFMSAGSFNGIPHQFAERVRSRKE